MLASIHLSEGIIIVLHLDVKLFTFFLSSFIKFKDLVSSIGGSLGLFTGISLLTLVEFFKLLFDLTKFLCKKKPVDPAMHIGNEKESEKPGF